RPAWPDGGAEATPLVRSGAGRGGGGLAGERPLAADAAPLALAHAAPDAELLAVHQGILEALGAHHAAAAHLLGLAGRGSPFREEEVGVDAEAVGVVLPGAVVGICGHGEFHLAPFPLLSPSGTCGP